MADATVKKAADCKFQIHVVGSGMGAMFGGDDIAAIQQKCSDMNAKAADMGLTARYEVRTVTV